MGPRTMKIMLLALLIAAKDINIVNSTGKSIDSKLCELSVFLISICRSQGYFLIGG